MTNKKEKEQLIIGTAFSEWKHALQELLKEHISLAKSETAHVIAKAFGEDYQPEDVDLVIQRFGRTKEQINKSKERCSGYAKICYYWLDIFNFVVELFDPEKEIANGDDYLIVIPKLLTENHKRKETPTNTIKKELLRHFKEMCDSMNNQFQHTMTQYELLKERAKQKEKKEKEEQDDPCMWMSESGRLQGEADRYVKMMEEQRKTKNLFQETYEYILENIL